MAREVKAAQGVERQLHLGLAVLVDERILGVLGDYGDGREGVGMGSAQRLEGLSAQHLAEHVEEALLDDGLDGGDVEGHVDQGLGQLGGELAGEDGIQQCLHVLAERLTDGNG